MFWCLQQATLEGRRRLTPLSNLLSLTFSDLLSLTFLSRQSSPAIVGRAAATSISIGIQTAVCKKGTERSTLPNPRLYRVNLASVDLQAKRQFLTRIQGSSVVVTRVQRFQINKKTWQNEERATESLVARTQPPSWQNKQRAKLQRHVSGRLACFRKCGSCFE